MEFGAVCVYHDNRVKKEAAEVKGVANHTEEIKVHMVVFEKGKGEHELHNRKKEETGS